MAIDDNFEWMVRIYRINDGPDPTRQLHIHRDNHDYDYYTLVQRTSGTIEDDHNENRCKIYHRQAAVVPIKLVNSSDKRTFDPSDFFKGIDDCIRP